VYVSQTTRDTLRRHVFDFGDQIKKDDNNVGFVIDGEVCGSSSLILLLDFFLDMAILQFIPGFDHQVCLLSRLFRLIVYF